MKSQHHNQNSPRNAPSVEEMRQALHDVFNPFVDQAHLSLEFYIEKTKKKDIENLYRQGYASPEFKEALATFFSDSSSPLSHLNSEGSDRNEPLTSKERMRIGLFQDVTELAHSYSADELGDLLLNCSGSEPLFTDVNLDYLQKCKGSLQLLQELGRVNLRWPHGETKLLACVSLVNYGATVELIEAFLSLKNEESEQVFISSLHIDDFLYSGGGLEDAQHLLSLQNSDQEHLFQHAGTLAIALSLRESRPELFYNLVHGTTDCGQPLFRYGEEINEYMNFNGGLRRARFLAGLKNLNGDRAFTGYDMALMKEARISVRESKNWSETACSTLEQIYCKKLGRENPDFQNDGRPKALLFVPGDDDHLFGVRVFLDATEGYFLSILRSYDVCIRGMSDKQRVFETLQESGADCALVSISGHGSPDSIAIARDTSRYHPEKTAEDFVLQKGDPDLFHALQNLPDDSVLFLDACGTANDQQNDEPGDHFAGKISKKVPHIFVFASRTPFSPDGVVLDSVLPLRLKVFAESQSVTYCSYKGVAHAPSFHQYDIRRDYEVTAKRLDEAPREYVDGPLRKSRYCRDLSEVARKISNAASPIRYMEDIQKAADAAALIPGVEIAERRDIKRDFQQSTWQFIFGEYLDKPWCPPYGNTFGSEASRIEIDPLGFLEEHGFELVKSPEPGDVVYYYQQYADYVTPESHPLSMVRLHHVGIYTDTKRVLSKPFRMHVLSHPDNLIPLSTDYDRNIKYFRLFFRES